MQEPHLTSPLVAGTGEGGKGGKRREMRLCLPLLVSLVRRVLGGLILSSWKLRCEGLEVGGVG